VRAPACVLLLAAVAAVDAARASAPPAARLDVVAEDRSGRTVEKLTVDDFEVIENGARKEIAAVTFVKGDGAVPAGEAARPIDSLADEQAEAAKDGTRIFALFLDEYHVAASEGAVQARRLLLEFLDRALGPRDLVLVVKPLDSLLALRATRDLGAVRHAIEQFDGRRDSYEPRSALEASITAGDPARTDAIGAQRDRGAPEPSQHLAQGADRRHRRICRARPAPWGGRAADDRFGDPFGQPRGGLDLHAGSACAGTVARCRPLSHRRFRSGQPERVDDARFGDRRRGPADGRGREAGV
jgi:hypothetical protein